MTLKALTADFAAAFVADKRDDGTKFYKLKEDCTHHEAFTDIVHAAHGGMMPDDTRYGMISEVADSLADTDPDDWDDQATETCDGLVDVYNAARLRWLASHLDRAGYCDEAVEEGLVAADADTFTRIGVGWFKEYEEIYHAITAGLRELAESLEPEEEGKE